MTGGFDEWHNDGALRCTTPTPTRRRRASPRASSRSCTRSARRKLRWRPVDALLRAAQPLHGPRRVSGARGGLKGLEEKYDGEVPFADKYIGECWRRCTRAASTRRRRSSCSAITAKRSASIASAASACTFTARRSTTSSCTCRSCSACRASRRAQIDTAGAARRSRADAARPGEGAAPAVDARALAARRAARRQAAAGKAGLRGALAGAGVEPPLARHRRRAAGSCSTS